MNKKNTVISIIVLTLFAIWIYDGIEPTDNGKPLTISLSANYPPFSFVDDENKHAGLLVDLWTLFAEENQLETQFLFLDQWDDTLTAVNDGRADIHGGLLFSPLRDKTLDFGPDVSPLETSLFVHNSISGSLSSFHEQNIAVVRGGMEEEFLRKHHPESRIIFFDNNTDLIRTAIAFTTKPNASPEPNSEPSSVPSTNAENSFNAFVADYPVALYLLHINDAKNLFSARETLYKSALKSAVNENDEKRLNILQSGFSALPTSKTDPVFQKWFRTESIKEEVIPSWLLWVILGSFLVLVVAFLITHIFLLRKQLLIKTDSLMRANKLLSEQSRRDPLTGALNRRAFMESIPALVSSAQRNNYDLAFCVIDLDYFKAINTDYTHLGGDCVLTHFVKLVQEEIRDYDVFARIGGEEFFLLCPDSNVIQAREILQRIQTKLRNTPPKFENNTINVTFSAGLTHCDFIDTSNKKPKSLKPEFSPTYERADKALFTAKEIGRNQIVIAPTTAPKE